MDLGSAPACSSGNDSVGEELVHSGPCQFGRGEGNSLSALADSQPSALSAVTGYASRSYANRRYANRSIDEREGRDENTASGK